MLDSIDDVEPIYGAAYLPRKFKIAIAWPGDTCADIYTNDVGIVPTLSQIWGHVIHAAVADHLDALGHFRDASHDPPHVDWLVSGSGFDRPGFEALVDDVVRFVAGPTPRKAAGRSSGRAARRR